MIHVHVHVKQTNLESCLTCVKCCMKVFRVCLNMFQTLSERIWFLIQTHLVVVLPLVQSRENFPDDVMFTVGNIPEASEEDDYEEWPGLPLADGKQE